MTGDGTAHEHREPHRILSLESSLGAAFERRQRRLARALPSAEFHPDETRLAQLLSDGGFGEVRTIMRVGDALLTVASRSR